MVTATRLILGLTLGQFALGQVFEPAGPQGFVLRPEQEAPLAVRVLSDEGKPLADIAVSFVAPEAGAGGRFAGASSETPFLVRARTDAQGIAQVRFTANDRQGLYLVDALVESTLQTTAFGITNTSDTIAPALSAEAVTKAVVEQLRLSSQTVQVNGPLLLEAGSAVKPAGPDLPSSTVDRRTWFFWVDDQPAAGFEHPVRFVYVDAADSDPRLEKWRISQEKWWPVVTLPGNRGVSSLLGPLARNRTRGHLSAVPPAFLKAFPAAPALRSVVGKEPNACAIVVYGSDEYAARNSQSAMENFFRNDKGIPSDRVLTTKDLDGDPMDSSPDDLKRLIEEARKKNCTKLYLYAVSHGAAGVICLRNPHDIDGTSPYLFFSYTELADLLKPFSDVGIKVTVILDACQTGSAIVPLHDSGLQGTVLTASSATEFCIIHRFSSFAFTSNLIQGWRDGTDLNGDGEIDEKEAAQWADDQIQGLTTTRVVFWAKGFEFPHAQWTDLDGTGGTLKVNEVRIFLDDPPTNPGSIVLPHPTTAVGAWEYTVFVDSEAIAAVPLDQRRGSLTGGPGSARATIPVNGIAEGETTYTVDAHDGQGKKYKAEGRILVGRSYLLANSQLTLNAGQSYTLVVYRSNQLGQAAGTLVVTPDGTETAAVASVTDASFKTGENSTTVTITANRGGVARFNLKDPSGRSTELTVRVNGYWVDPNPVRVRAGQTVEALLWRHGITGNLRIRAKSNFDREIAGVGPESVAEAAFPEFANSQAIRVTGLTAGTSLWDIEDEKGNKYELTIIVESAGTFVASAPVFTQTGDGQEIDVGVRNANGQLVPLHSIGVSAVGLQSLQAYNPNDESRPPARRDAAREAVEIPPGGKVAVVTNSAGFVRMLYVAGPVGLAMIRFEAPAFGVVDYPIAISARLANPPDQIQVTPPSAAIRVNTDAVLQVGLRRSGQPLVDGLVTFQITGGTFSDGSRFNNNTTSQVRTSSAGTASATFRPTAAGPVLIRVFAGQLAQDVRMSATN